MTRGVSIEICSEDLPHDLPNIVKSSKEEIYIRMLSVGKKKEITPVDTPSISCSNMMFALKVRPVWEAVL